MTPGQEALLHGNHIWKEEKRQGLSGCPSNRQFSQRNCFQMISFPDLPRIIVIKWGPIAWWQIRKWMGMSPSGIGWETPITPSHTEKLLTTLVPATLPPYYSWKDSCSASHSNLIYTFLSHTISFHNVYGWRLPSQAGPACDPWCLTMPFLPQKLGLFAV